MCKNPECNTPSAVRSNYCTLRCEKKMEASKVSEVQVGREYTEARKRSRHFYTKPARESDAGNLIFYFQHTGDYLKGQLFGTGHKEYRHYSNKTYLLKVTEGRQAGEDFIVLDGDSRIEEIVAYKDLRRLIEQNNLMFETIRIVSAGKIGTMGGHYRLVWEVYKETHSLVGEQKQTATPVKKRKKKGVKKHGKRSDN